MIKRKVILQSLKDGSEESVEFQIANEHTPMGRGIMRVCDEIERLQALVGDLQRAQKLMGGPEE